MDFEHNDSLEVDAILERIKNKLSERHSNNNVEMSSDSVVRNNTVTYSSPVIKKPLLLDDSQVTNNNLMSINNSNIIPNPFNDFTKNELKYSNNNIVSGIIDLTPNMEIHQNYINNIDASSNKDEPLIEINLTISEYKLLVEVLSKRFSKAFYASKLQPKIEKWLDINLKDLLVSK